MKSSWQTWGTVPVFDRKDWAKPSKTYVRADDLAQNRSSRLPKTV